MMVMVPVPGEGKDWGKAPLNRQKKGIPAEDPPSACPNVRHKSTLARCPKPPPSHVWAGFFFSRTTKHDTIAASMQLKQVMVLADAAAARLRFSAHLASPTRRRACSGQR